MYNHTVGAIDSGGTLSFAEGEQINSIGNAQQVASYAKVIGDVAIATNVQYGYASANNTVELSQAGIKVGTVGIRDFLVNTEQSDCYAGGVVNGAFRAVFDLRIPPNEKVYYIKEQAAPDGFAKSNKVYCCKVKADGTVTYKVQGEFLATYKTDIPVCENIKLPDNDVDIDNITIMKKYLNSHNEIITPGTQARFTVYRNELCTIPVSSNTVNVSARNTLNVNMLILSGDEFETGKTYYIKETQAPVGFAISNDVFCCRIASDGSVTYAVKRNGVTSDFTDEIPICKNLQGVTDLTTEETSTEESSYYQYEERHQHR